MQTGSLRGGGCLLKCCRVVVVEAVAFVAASTRQAAVAAAGLGCPGAADTGAAAVGKQCNEGPLSAAGTMV